jgi:hypothetical protein
MKQTPNARPARITLPLIVRCASRLTERDRQIALDCYDHHVLTTGQLQRLHFPSVRAACARLHALYLLRVLDRFRPPWERGQGSTQWHWILDETGAYIVAEQLGIERKELNWRRASALAIAASAKLHHHIEVNEFFARLASEAAAQGGALTEWYGERTTQRLFQGRITPDGYGVLNLVGCAPLHVLLELDRATEPTERLHGKATRYAQELPRSVLSDACPVIIMAVPTSARAKAASAATATTAAPITVAVWSEPRSLLEIVTSARG